MQLVLQKQDCQTSKLITHNSSNEFMNEIAICISYRLRNMAS